MLRCHGELLVLSCPDTIPRERCRGTEYQRYASDGAARSANVRRRPAVEPTGPRDAGWQDVAVPSALRPSAGGASSSARRPWRCWAAPRHRLRDRPRPQDVDALIAQLDRARSDSQLATAPRPPARTRRRRGADRRRRRTAAHAQALTDEITRISGEAPPTRRRPRRRRRRPTTPRPRAAAQAAHRGGRRRRPEQSADSAARWRPSSPATAPACSARSRRPARRPAPSRSADVRGDVMTSPSTPPADPVRGPSDAADAALFDAIAAEHGVIYGYGLVSAHSTPDVNDLVSERDGASTASGARRPSRARRAQRRRRRCPRPAISCRSRSTTPPMPPSWRCGWRRTPRWRGGRCSSRRPTGEDRDVRGHGADRSARSRPPAGARCSASSPITVAFPGGTE